MPTLRLATTHAHLRRLRPPPGRRRRPRRQRHRERLPDSGCDAAGFAGRPGRTRPRPHRLRQDLRLPAAGGRPPGEQLDASPGRSPARPDPGPHPRTRRTDRRRAGAVGQGHEPALGHHLRWRRRAATDRQAAGGRRHRHRLPRPARGPHAVPPRRPVRGGDHRARRGRPHGRSRLPARRSSG